MDVRPSGIFSVTNITMANARNRSVIVAGLMIIFPSLYINFIFQRVMIRPGFI
jgi:hypothetical protein